MKHKIEFTNFATAESVLKKSMAAIAAILLFILNFARLRGGSSCACANVSSAECRQ